MLLRNVCTQRPDYTKHDVIISKTTQYESCIRSILFCYKKIIILLFFFLRIKMCKTKQE